MHNFQILDGKRGRLLLSNENVNKAHLAGCLNMITMVIVVGRSVPKMIYFINYSISTKLISHRL